MNWDQQLIKACTETDGTPHPHTDHVLTGAKWQREQLRTPEAVERLAMFLLDDEGYDTSNGWPSNELLGGGPTVYREAEFKAAWMDHTRAAITALLGDSDND